MIQARSYYYETTNNNVVSLTQPDGTPLIMINSEPALPKEIVADSTEIIYFTSLHLRQPP
jgi:hypothetical protein